MLKGVLALFIKEILANWRERSNRYLLIFSPIIQVLVFSFATTQEVRNVPLAIFDQDQTAATRELISRFEGSPQFSRVIRLGSDAEIAEIIDARIAPAVLYIRSDFSRKLDAGEPVQVQLLLDGRRSNAARRFSVTAISTRRSPTRASRAGWGSIACWT